MVEFHAHNAHHTTTTDKTSRISKTKEDVIGDDAPMEANDVSAENMATVDGNTSRNGKTQLAESSAPTP